MKRKTLYQPENTYNNSRASLSFIFILCILFFLLQTCIPQITGEMVDYVNDETGFIATPGNHEVTLDWVPDPSASGYTIYYTTDGSLPSENNGFKIEDVRPPYLFTGLANGRLHVFMVETQYETIENTFSPYIEAIPLSEFTLAPIVKGHGSIGYYHQG